MATIPPAPVTDALATIQRHLAEYLGKYTAKNAIKTFSMRAIGIGPESLNLTHLPELLTAMRPMLRTLLGATTAEDVLVRLRQELRI